MSRVGELYSVGIDIGTTTTQIVFSRLQLEKSGGFGTVPTVQIAKKDVVYKSPVYFTPLLSEETVDAVRLKDIVSEEYKKSKLQITDISTGAVIITGESARKENAREVARQLAEFSGDFVVCTAGPYYEAVLAGQGAGAGELSKKRTERIGNFDIGGGTTNTAVFQNGEVLETFAADIGGRLVRVNADGIVTYVSRRIGPLIQSLDLCHTKPGENADFGELDRLTKRMAAMFPELCGKRRLQEDTKRLFIGRRPGTFEMDSVMFSGGVAEYIYADTADAAESIRKYGDIGPLLGANIQKILPEIPRVVKPAEKIRATVVGAGSYSMGISGTTIAVDNNILPLKNIPVIVADCTKPGLSQAIENQLRFFEDEQVAVSLKGLHQPGYQYLKTLAEQIFSTLEKAARPIIILTENDCAKALGLLLSNVFKKSRPIVCLDRVAANSGDFVDIGMPVCGIVPVIIKTLIFGC
jgi:Ethanolamine utilization protein, possible chaperonin protecting lyase from inhibition